MPSFEYERLHCTSNLNTWRDGMRVLRALVIERLNSKGKVARDRSLQSSTTPAARLVATTVADVEESDARTA